MANRSSMDPVDFTLVIPSFRESVRLPGFLADLQARLHGQPFSTEVVVVDDGSGASERDSLARLLDGYKDSPLPVRSVLLDQNRGKGFAVRAGWAATAGARWLAFADADGATSAAEVARVFHLAYALPDSRVCFFGSRVRMLGHSVGRNWKRHYAGRLYATLVSVMIDQSVYDSQCGFKVLPAEAFAAIADRLREDRFAFDAELIVALSQAGFEMREVPVDWIDVPGSKVSLVRDSIRMVRSLLRIRRARLAGAYAPRPTSAGKG